MAASSTDGGVRGFFTYYRVYARSGIHAASAAALTALIGLASFVNGWFVVLAIAVYVFPPLFLYLTAEGKNVPSIIGDENHDRGAAGADDEQRRVRDDTSGDIDHSRRSDASNIHSAHVDSTSDTDADGSPSMSVSGVSNSVAPPEEDMSTADDGGPGWIAVDVPIDKTLCAVATARDGVYAVGKHGVVLARHGGAWETVLERGPAAQSNTLRGMDTTSDGEIVWFAGDSGVLGRYDVESARHTDHSDPNDETSTWADIAITGPVGEENIHLVNGSGEYLRGEFKDGEVDWGEPQKPGSGSSMTSINFVDRDLGYICDTNQGVFETTDGGEHYEMPCCRAI